MKICTKCKQNKNIEDFYKNAKRKDGRQTFCKVCSNARRIQWGRENPDKIRKYKLRNDYDLSVEDFELMLKEQNNRCKICKKEFVNSLLRHIDHDHKTGRVRGILCNKCNLMIGWYESIPDHKTILLYLQKV